MLFMHGEDTLHHGDGDGGAIVRVRARVARMQMHSNMFMSDTGSPDRRRSGLVGNTRQQQQQQHGTYLYRPSASARIRA